MSRTLLCIFAHPDDETFGPGGTLALYADRGYDVYLVCSTRGEAGTIGDSASFGRRRLAATREQELTAACKALGIHPPRLLSLPDGGLSRLAPETLVRPFVHAIRDIRPTVLLSFHENGISGHLDHRTVTARSRTAFRLAAEKDWPELGPPHATQRFWAYCIPESRARELTVRRLHSVPDADLDAVLDVQPYLKAKRDAITAHATQKPFIDNLEAHLGNMDRFWNRETFVLAEARVPLSGDTPLPVGDLFAGLDVA